MKKFITMAAALTAVMCITACGQSSANKISTAETENKTTAAETETVTTTAAVVENEKPVSLYYMNYEEDEAELIKSYNWSLDDDIPVFGAFAGDEETIGFSSEITAHQDNWDSVSTSQNYQIGYEISFDLDGENKVITILEPQDIEDSEYLFMGDVDTEEVTGYLGVWVYDDYHQDGSFYTHVLPDEFTSDTLLTSIKIHSTPKSSEIENLKIKVFSYSSSLEFDEDGHYNNDYGYTISIYCK